MRPVRRSGDRGFTLIEVAVTITVMSALMGFVVGGWRAWSAAHAHRSAAVDVQVTMRDAQQRAVTEGSSTCLLFDADADVWRLYSGRCDSATKVLVGGPWGSGDQRVDLVDPEFVHGPGSTLAGVTFSPRGTATPGRVIVARSDNGTVHTVRVEGLTGRVSVD